MFPIVEAFGKAIDREYVENAREMGAALRGHADQGRRRGASLPLAERRVRRLRDLGQGQPRRQRARRRRRCSSSSMPRSALKNRPQARGAKLGTNPYQVRPGRQQRRAHRPDARSRRTTSSARPRRRSRAPSACTPTFMNNPKTGVKIMDWEVCASGYAAVWAEENTRASIWDAMQRKETYATTGSRMVVRFFGGWDFESGRAHSRTPGRSPATPKACRWAAIFIGAPAGKSPNFLVAAMKDPIGAQPRPHPGHQRLARCEGRAAGESL